MGEVINMYIWKFTHDRVQEFSDVQEKEAIVYLWPALTPQQRLDKLQQIKNNATERIYQLGGKSNV